MIALHDELDAAIPPLPPSSVDVDRLISRGRRGTQLRVAAGAAGTSGLVAGLVVLSAFVGTGGGGTAQTAASPGHRTLRPSPSPSDIPHPTADPSPPQVTGRPDIDRLNTLLLASFHRVAPNVTTVVSYQGQPGDPNVSCSPGEPQTSPGSCGTPLPVMYELSFSVSKDGRYSAVFVQVGTAATVPNMCLTDTPGQASPNPKCHPTTVNGVTVLDLSSDVQGTTSVTYYVLTGVHKDGTVVKIYVNAPKVGEKPLLTKEQAIQLVVDPTVSLA